MVRLLSVTILYAFCVVTYGCSLVVEHIVLRKYFVANFWFISCSHLTFHSCLDSFVMVSLYSKIKVNSYFFRQVFKFY